MIDWKNIKAWSEAEEFNKVLSHLLWEAPGELEEMEKAARFGMEYVNMVASGFYTKEAVDELAERLVSGRVPLDMTFMDWLKEGIKNAKDTIGWLVKMNIDMEQREKEEEEMEKNGEHYHSF